MSSSVAEETPDTQYSEIPELGIEQGVDSSMPFTAPFNPVGLGLKKSSAEILRRELQEVLKEDDYDVLRPTVRQLITMRRLDGHARALYRLLTLPIRAALNTATFKPAEGGEEEAEYIDAVFRTGPANGGMTTTFQRFMGQLLGALFEGFACFEKVFWIPETGPLAGKITLKKLAWRPSDTITFIADKNGGFAGVRQRAFQAGKTIDVHIEPEYAFYYAAQEDERKFYGVSFFESAFPHYDAKAKAYFTAHLAAQRAAVGTRIGTVPPNASPASKKEFAKNLGNLALAQWMMVPENFKVEVLKEAGSFDFLNLINHHNHMMSESVLANFFDKDSGGGSGESGALVNFAQPGDDMFVLMLRAIMDDIANHINHYIIPQLVDYNFDGGKYPTFAWGTFTDEQRAAIAATFDKLATAGQGINVSKEFMRELEKNIAKEMGLEIDWEAVEAREAEEEAQQLAMQGGGLPADGSPLPGESTPLSDEELNSVTDLSDVLSIMAKKSDEAAAAGGSGMPAPTDQPAGPTPPTQKKLPQPPKNNQPGGTVKLSGITDDMIDWAFQMVGVAGEDWTDG